jgi:hypothetical protein
MLLFFLERALMPAGTFVDALRQKVSISIHQSRQLSISIAGTSQFIEQVLGWFFREENN